jgi:hypothetical protein
MATYPPRDTVGGIVQAIQAEFALSQSVEDATGRQLTNMISSAGRELVLIYPWQQFNKDFSIDLDGVTESFDLPSDWEYFVDQTQWDTTNRWPLPGPSSPQQWKWLNSGIIAFTPRVRYRVRANKLYVFPHTGTSHIVMEYISGEWVEAADGSERFRSVQTTDDVVLLDSFLLQKYAKLKFWEMKGFDTTAFRDDFLRVFMSLTGKDKGAPVLSLAPIRTSRLLTTRNVPEGNWDVGPG